MPRPAGTTNLVGSYQLWNAALAVSAIRAAGLKISNDVIDRGLLHVEWRGRFQRVGDRVVLDGAHNPSAATRLAVTWQELFGTEKATLILGILEDKDMRGIVAALLPIASRVIAVPVRNPRSASAHAVAGLVRELAPETQCEAQADLPAAIASGTSGPGRLLIAGSLFLAGEALACFDGSAAGQVSAQ
jgi:dihydrofolate synthase/folylpolyglutamate synthase